MVFTPEITTGNIITMLTALIAVVGMLLRVKWQGEQNLRDIDALRKEREAAAADIRRELSEVKFNSDKSVELVHKRLVDHTDKLTEAINGMMIETRAMHAENFKFRERVASEFVTYARLTEVLDKIDRNFTGLGERIDTIVEKFLDRLKG